MLPLRKHPSITWTAPYENDVIDESTFTTVDRIALIERNDTTIIFGSENIRLRIIVCDSGIVRFTYTPEDVMPEDVYYPSSNGDYAIFKYDWPSCHYLFEQTRNDATIVTSKLKVIITFDPFVLIVQDIRTNALLLSTHSGFGYKKRNDSYETLSFFKLTDDDEFYGFGGRIHRPNRRGSTADMFATKVWHERGDYGGFPIPYFLNPKGYGFILNNPWPHVYFDMGRTYKNKWFLHTPGGPLDFYILAGPDFFSITNNYCRLTGFPALPSKWQLGFWVSWVRPDEPEEKCIEIVKRFRNERWPLDVLVLDMYWRGGRLNLKHEGESGKDFGWDTERFGDGTKLIPFLHENDAHICLHLNTTMFVGNSFKEGMEKNYLRKENKSVIVPCLTNKDAEEWYWGFHQPITEQGVDLWWVDNSERVDGILENGHPSRNLYGYLWNDFLFKRMAAHNHPNKLVLSRSGWVGSQKHVLAWPGDTAPGVDRLQEDLWWQMNCALSGIVYNTVDLGGFIEQEFSYENSTQIMHARENMVRRVIHGILFTTVPRIHGPQKFPWQYESDIQELYRYYLELRYRLFPYLYSYIVKGTQTGESVYRPLAWDFQSDKVARDNETQLMFGNWILIAPVTMEGYLEWEVYLPEGRWIDFWTLKKYDGGRYVVVDTPIKERHGLPIFIREGAVIPMRPMCYFNQDEPEKELMLHIFPCSGEMHQTFYDDEVNSYNVRYTYTESDTVIEIDNPLSEERIIHFVIHADGAPLLTNKTERNTAFPFESGIVKTVVMKKHQTQKVHI